MSIVTPIPQQSLIILYQGVGWNPDYNDIRLFDNAGQRDTYLNGKLIGQWQNCSVVKPGESIRLQGRLGDMISANYLSFTNGNLGSSYTWYAFVTSVNYVNVNTVEIQYSIDWIQSYLFSFDFKPCLIDREHVNDDSFGVNVVEENISISDYVITEILRERYQKGYVVYFLSDAASSVDVDSKNGMLIATQFTANRELVRGNLQMFLQQLNANGESDKVVSLSMCPMPIGDQADITNPNLKMTFGLQDDHITFSNGSKTYTAKNRKMGCYPYKLFTVDNFNGSVQEFKWENFRGNPAFEMNGVLHPRPCLECYPTNYMHWWGENIPTRNFAVQYTNFPQIPWTSDTFRAWVSQNGTAMFWDNVGKGVTIAGGALGGIISAATGHAAGVAVGAQQIMQGLSGLEKNQASTEYHATHGSQLGGALEACGMDYLNNDIGFRVIEYAIKPEVAERIDKFFTRYGYRVDAVKTPNIRGRRYFNYVKCVNAIVEGVVPVDAKQAMENALINGCTFWHTDDIGTVPSSNPIV